MWRYRRRISGPLLDRIDLQVDVPPLDPSEYDAPPPEGGSTAALAAQVARAERRRAGRSARLGCDLPNADLDGAALLAACDPEPQALTALTEVLRRRRASGRMRVRLLRVARTLADLRDADSISDVDVLEAAALRRDARE